MNYIPQIKKSTLFLFIYIAPSSTSIVQTFVEVGDLQIALGIQTYTAPTKNKTVTAEKLSIAGGVTELLMQSHEGSIRLIPALPDNWKTEKISGLVARGNIEVDLEWVKGMLTKLGLLTKKTPWFNWYISLQK